MDSSEKCSLCKVNGSKHFNMDHQMLCFFPDNNPILKRFCKVQNMFYKLKILFFFSVEELPWGKVNMMFPDKYRHILAVMDLILTIPGNKN